MIKWAKVRWPDAVINNLNDLNQLITDKQLQQQVIVLSAALYKKQVDNWNGKLLLQAIVGLKFNEFLPTKKGRLPSINP